jgi:hypothetical protein
MKTVSAVLVFSVLLVSLIAVIPAAEAESNGYIAFSSGVTLFSPLNRTYTSKFLTLNFSFACGMGLRYSLSYYIDGEYGGPMPYVVKNPEELHVVYHATGLVNLPELSEGLHSLTINLQVAPSSNHIKPSYTDTVNFAIDLAPPNVSILSPANKTYAVANVAIPLDYTTTEELTQLTVSLDGQNDTLTAGNTTLTGLSVGSHNVTLYARDLAGHTGASETVDFVITAELEPQTAPEPFPVLPLAAASVIAAVFTLLLCRKRQRTTAEEEKHHHSQVLERNISL